MKIRLCIFEGNCVSDSFCLLLILDHNQKHCFLCAVYGDAHKKEVISQFFVAMGWLRVIWKNVSALYYCDTIPESSCTRK